MSCVWGSGSLRGLLPKRTCVWIDDDVVDDCYKCHYKFTWFVRRHHCRGCGRIFCHTCSNYYLLTSQSVSKSLVNPDQYLHECVGGNIAKSAVRMCMECLQIYHNIRDVCRLVMVLELLPITLVDIYTLRQLNRQWYQACSVYLSKFREIQYHILSQPYNQFECRILHQNRALIRRHSVYWAHYLKSNLPSVSSLDAESPSPSPSPSHGHGPDPPCSKLMCDHSCQPRLSVNDVIDILIRVDQPGIRQHVVKILSGDFDPATDGINYLPLFIQCLKIDMYGDVVKTLLLTWAVECPSFRIKLFWTLMVRVQMSEFNSVYRQFLTSFFKTLEDNVGNDAIDRLQDCVQLFRLFDRRELSSVREGPYTLPIWPTMDGLWIELESIEKLRSHTAPLLVPVVGCGDHEFQSKFIYKYEDVRGDSIVMSIIKLADKILKDHDLDLDIVTYDVIPTSPNSGIIEVVEDAETIYAINNKYNQTLLQYLISKCPHRTVDDIRLRFIRSTSAYCVLTYLLGVGDRHLDNIMITGDGRLFHIDYSYLLGTDCKPLSTKIKITDQMVEVMDGTTSHYYQKFEWYCSQIYNLLRRESTVFINLLSLLSDSRTRGLDLGTIEREISSRFLPGELHSQAKIHLINHIHWSQSSSVSGLTDFFHYHYKEHWSTLNPLNLFTKN